MEKHSKYYELGVRIANASWDILVDHLMTELPAEWEASLKEREAAMGRLLSRYAPHDDPEWLDGSAWDKACADLSNPDKAMLIASLNDEEKWEDICAGATRRGHQLVTLMRSDWGIL
jgi:hypothetical protein